MPNPGRLERLVAEVKHRMPVIRELSDLGVENFPSHLDQKTIFKAN